MHRKHMEPGILDEKWVLMKDVGRDDTICQYTSLDMK